MVLCDDTPYSLRMRVTHMDRSEAHYQFRQADTLYRQRYYEEALAMLRKLDRDHPDTRHILYPIARCLSRLERYDEAIELTGRIAEQFDYGPARELHERLRKSTESAPIVNISSLDIDLSAPLQFASGTSPPPLPGESSPSASLNWALCLGLIVMLAILVVGRKTIMVEFWDWYAVASEQSNSLQSVPPIGSMMAVLFEIMVLGCAAGCAGAYCGLGAVQALPYTTFDDNLKDISLYVFFGLLLSFIPVLGWIAILVMLYKHYELSFGRLFVVCFVYMAVGTLAYYGLIFFVEFAAAIV